MNFQVDSDHTQLYSFGEFWKYFQWSKASIEIWIALHKLFAFKTMQMMKLCLPETISMEISD